MSVRDKLLSTTTRRYKRLDVERVGEVWIQSLTEGERSRIEIAASADLSQLAPWFIAYAVIDGDGGNRVFAEDDLEAVMSMDSSVTAALLNAIEEHCKVGRIDLEDAVKN